MNKEILITCHYSNIDMFKYVRGDELNDLVRAIEQAGATARLVALQQMQELPDNLPLTAINLNSWPNDTHLIYLRRLELAGVKLLNSAYGSRIANDKMLCYLELQGVVPQPRTVHWDVRYHWDKIPKLVDQVGLPCVVKVNSGSRGIGVYKLNTLDELEDFLNFAAVIVPKSDSGQYPHNLLVQSYVPQDPMARVVRVIVVGNKCMGAQYRYNVSNWRTGRHMPTESLTEYQGEHREPIAVDSELQRMSLAVCQKLELNYASVDFFYGPNGYVLNEVGTSPDTLAYGVNNQLNIYDNVVDFVLNRS
jgi:RimK family alpha-L-glutamate ligase